MAVHPISRSQRVGEDMAPLTAGAHTLYTQSGKPQTCARRLLCIAETTFSVLANSGDVNCAPAAAIPAGTQIDADVSAITFTGGPLLVFW